MTLGTRGSTLMTSSTASSVATTTSNGPGRASERNEVGAVAAGRGSNV